MYSSLLCSGSTSYICLRSAECLACDDRNEYEWLEGCLGDGSDNSRGDGLDEDRGNGPDDWWSIGWCDVAFRDQQTVLMCPVLPQ